jgi:serine/threonine-protein kinase
MAVLANRYELGDALGAGGMARVVSAYDNVLHRDVAIKLIHDSSAGDPTSRERMLREARAAAGLHHPNTVAVFDAGEADGRPFIVMERVVGWSLGDRLQDEGPLSVADTLAIADAVLAALQAAHARGLVHRDVKPSNILLPDSGGVKLADFGIAKALAETSAGLTSTGQLLGTPRYLAPEQVAGRPASPASALYSLAVVLYQCLTGEPPFMAETPLAEALAHQREPVPEVAKAAPHVPAAVARTVERALALMSIRLSRLAPRKRLRSCDASVSVAKSRCRLPCFSTRVFDVFVIVAIASSRSGNASEYASAVSGNSRRVAVKSSNEGSRSPSSTIMSGS